MTLKAFAPSGDDSDTLAVTTASARAQLDPNSNAVRVVNDGTATAFIQFGDANVVATTAKMPIRPGASETFTKGSAGYVAAICASGSTTLYVTCGEGL
jgi:hypothetical protein